MQTNHQLTNQSEKINIEYDFHKFSPKDFLAQYYAAQPQDDKGEDFSLHWFQMVYDWLKPKGKLLEFSAGPTIYSLITAAKYMQEIHVSDYLAACLDEIIAWQKNRGHDWSEYIRRSIELEQGSSSQEEIFERHNIIRQKITKFMLLDERQGAEVKNYYDVLSVNFVPDSTTQDRNAFIVYTRHILDYLKPKGILVMGVMKESTEYKVGNKWFPAVYLNEQDLENSLQYLGIELKQMISIKTYDQTRHVGGYIYAAGYKK